MMPTPDHSDQSDPVLRAAYEHGYRAWHRGVGQSAAFAYGDKQRNAFARGQEDARREADENGDSEVGFPPR